MRSYRSHLCSLVYVLLAALCMPLDALATDYFVRKTGNNANAGTTAGTAWLTVDYGVDQLVAGDTLYIGAGTYTEDVSPAATCTGTSGNPIKVIGDTDGSQTGDAGDVLITASSTRALYLDGSGHDYLEFYDLKFSGGSEQAVDCAPTSTGVLLDNCEVSGATKHGIRWDSSSVTIRNCSIHNNGNYGISIHSSSTGTIEDSSFYANTLHGIVIISSTVTMNRCRICDNQVRGISITEGTVTLNNCLISGSGTHGVSISNHATNVTDLQNCTIVKNGTIGLSYGGGINSVTNCIIADNVSSSFYSAASVTRLNNLIYGNGSGNTAANATEIVADPQFASAADYHITMLSPARNAGTDLSGTVDDDLEGRARPYDGAYDMGCYEEGPLAHWKNDETSGTTAFDSSGFSHDGTHSGSPTWSTSGIRDGSLDFETSDGVDRVDAGNFDVVGTQLTLSAWVRQEDPLYDGRIIEKSDGNTDSDQSWGMAIDENGELDFRINVGGTWSRVQAPGVISPNTWYHVVGTYDGTMMRLYLDGQLIASTAHPIGGAIVGDSSHTVTLGDSPIGGRPFDGLIDDARIYDRTLSVDEIIELAGGLVGHWKLDETSGTTAADSSAFGNDGTYTGSAQLGVAAVRDLGTEFSASGTSDLLTLPSVVLDGVSSLSVGFWIRTSGTSGEQTVISAANSLQDNEMKIVFLTNTVLEVVIDNVAQTMNIESVATDRWVHFAIAMSSTTTTIYRDGELIGTMASHGTGGSLSIQGLVVGQDQDWLLGGYGPARRLIADLDDLTLYNTAIDEATVAELYGLVGHWKLDETSGTVAADSTGSGFDGTHTGGVTVNANGPYPGVGAVAADFDGTDDNVDLPDMKIDYSSGLTVAFWVKPSQAPGTGEYYVFLDLANGQAVDEIWLGWINNVGFQLYMTDNADGSTLKTIEDNTNLEVGKWVHLVATVDSAGNATLYRNGEVTKSGFYTSIPTNVLRTQTFIAMSPWDDNFPGSMDDVRLYNRPLSATEISELYGLTGHWKMDEGAGSAAADSTGFANNATLNGATWTTDCTGKTALEFDGLNDTAATNSNFTPPDTGTVTFWMRGADTPNATGRVFGINGDWEARQGTDGSVSFDLGASPFVGDEPFVTPIVDDIFRWYHIVAMFDASDDSYSVYVNGVLEASGISPVDLVTQTAGILTFGTRTGSTEYWLGAMRDFRIYNRWLSGSEISELSGLVAYWKLDESSGTVAVDSSPNGNDGTYTNGVTLFQTGQVDQAAEFDGSDDYVGVPDDPTLQMDDVFSLSMWIRPDSSSNIDQMILNKEGEYEIAISPSDELKWGITNTDPGWSWHSTGHIVAIGKWTHVALIYDNGSVTTYANGVLVDTYNGSGVVGDNNSSLNELRLGGRSNNPSGKYFDGRLDDIRVFKRVLCSEEVFGQYKGGRPTGVRILKWVEVR